MFEHKSEIIRFLTVVKHGSVVAAAREFGLTQPAVSYTISGIEMRAGGPLFERLPPPRWGVRLTPLGEVATQHARRILNEFEDSEAQAASFVAGREGCVRVAGSAVFLQVLLPGAVAAFHEEHPGIEVVLRPVGGDVPGLLDDGAIDLYCGIMGDGAIPPGLRCDALPEMTAGIVARQGHPLQGRVLSWEDLAGYPWIDTGIAAEDEAVEAIADRPPRNLDELLEVLRADAIWPGAPLAHGKLDWASLPLFGGPDVPDPVEVWSWDDERMLVGTCPEDLSIVERAEGC